MEQQLSSFNGKEVNAYQVIPRSNFVNFNLFHLSLSLSEREVEGKDRETPMERCMAQEVAAVAHKAVGQEEWQL